MNRAIKRMLGVLSPPGLKGDLEGLLGGYLIPPVPPLGKGGVKTLNYMP
jgi:hypothetical protein